MKQRQGILEELRMRKLTTPYSDVARLLGCPIGTTERAAHPAAGAAGARFWRDVARGRMHHHDRAAHSTRISLSCPVSWMGN